MISSLSEESGFLKAVFDTVVDPLVIIDAKGTVIAANNACERVLGWSPESLIGQPLTCLMPTSYRPLHDGYIQRFLETQEQRIIGIGRELQAVTRSGDAITIHLSVSHCEIGGKDYFTGLIRDVSSQKAYRQLLEHREQVMNSVLNAPDEVIIVFDAELCVVMANKSALRSLNRDKPITGLTMREFLPLEVAESRERAMRRIIETKQTAQFSDARNGRFFENIISPVVDDDGDVILLTVFARDITQKKLSKARLVNVSKQAEQANRAKTEFLANMSHELRTPLNSIIGFSHILKDDETLTEDQKDSVKYISDSGAYLKELIDDVLDLARIESGKLTVNSSQVDLANVLHQVLEMLRFKIEKQQLNLSLDIAGDVRPVKADPVRLKQVLINLVDNAINYNKPGGSIQIVCAIKGTWLNVDFIDTGIGISPHQLTELFQPFNRLGLENSNVPGTGVGLALSKRLIEAMGGQLKVTSEHGIGSTFSIQLELHELMTQGVESPIFDPNNYPRVNRPRLKLLYVDNAEQNIVLFERYVKAHAHWSIITSDIDVSVLQEAQQHLPDVIVMDLSTTDTVLDLAVVLSQHPRLQDTPIVGLTSDLSEEARQAGESAGVDIMLSKPLNFELLDKVLLELAGK